MTAVNCTSPTPKPATVPTTTTTTGPGTTTTAPTQNTGNTTSLSTGDTTIALEGSTAITTNTNPALSKLGFTPTNTPGTSNQQIWFDTKTASNGAWPVSKLMSYSDYGTCINDGGADPLNPGLCKNGTGGHGLGGNYKLYRYYDKGTKIDEELQVWTWGNSYATQYRDVTASGTDPQHQAWSFGGNYTPVASMPTAGIMNYTGQWGGTAKTSNFYDNLTTGTVGQTMSFNNNWRVSGTSSLTANFGTGQFAGTLTPWLWEGVNKDGNFSQVDVAAAQAFAAQCAVSAPACNPASPSFNMAQYNNLANYNAAYMNVSVILAGSIKTDAKNTTKPNQVVGTASMDPTAGWITSANNPMFAGFFGPAAKEVTGAFAFDATIPAPNGGLIPINNDRRAYIEMSGIFNATSP
ncbi:MAG: hypothetical protein KGO53_08060 [Alphaproteobacteria bacterium]|nr:hypothetical protein [Alphaproteobacteria bacterium]